MNKSISIAIAGFLSGAALLCMLATLQKSLVDAPLDLLGYAVPILFGGIAGALIGLAKHRIERLITRLRSLETTLKQQVADKTRELETANRILADMALHDGLTQVWNHRGFEKALRKEWSRWERNHVPFSLLMCDIDYFKEYNDTYGHPRGDHCLRDVARALRESLHRPADFIARYGGEEFVIILPGTDLEGARAVGEGARLAVRNLAIPHEHSRCANVVTVSVGIAESRQVPLDAGGDHLIEAADKALYHAKNDGRDRVQRCELPAVDGGRAALPGPLTAPGQALPPAS